MTDTDTLRPEVREALSIMDRDCPVTIDWQRTAWGIIRAELLRLAKENSDLLSTIELDEQVWVQRDETMHKWIERAREAEAELAALRESALGGYEDGWHALRNERDALKAELAALRARIEGAPVAELVDCGLVTQQWFLLDADSHGRLALPPMMSGQRVRLVQEDGDA